MEIPENTPVQRENSQYMKILIHGDPFVGKTTFASTFDDLLILSTDGNYRHLTAPAIDFSYNEVRTLTSGHEVVESGWERFKKVAEALKTDTQYSAVAVDLLTDIYQMCRLYVLKKNGIKDESELSYGKAYKLIDDEFLPVIKDVLSLKKHVICIAHSKEVLDAKGEKVEQIRANIPNSLKTKITGYFGAYTYLSKLTSPAGDTFRVLAMANDYNSSSNRWGITKPVLADYSALRDVLNEEQEK